MKLAGVQKLYYAWYLTHRKSVSDDSRFTGVLSEARVDLNPHQVDAALFAFKSPLSKGAILADEVGLGKTIEAGIILSQFWAEHRRKILIILPASLRSQWNLELMEKFYLPSTILVSSTYDDLKSLGRNPFEQNAILLCSYQFAAKHADEINKVMWDLIVLDEAHKMRNVYKKKNKLANIIRAAIQPYKKVLLTATPLQNNLNELYGLVSIIDKNYFSTLDNFSEEYNAVTTRDNARYGALKERLQNIIQRTLRRQVQEYVKYTRRSAIVQDFVLSKQEQTLYDGMTDYLQRPISFGVPEEMRALMTIMIRKIMASSSHALSYTLDGMIKRLEAYKESGDMNAPFVDVQGDIEGFDDDEREYNIVGINTELTSSDLDNEIAELKEFKKIACGIINESKAVKLLSALKIGFNKMTTMGGEQKALIFTESCRTQEYLKEFLENNGYCGNVVCFNGTNSSMEAKSIHKAWLERHRGSDLVSGDTNIDRKQALVEYFRDHAKIMIATEAGAEGINLQFSSIVVNYDMPWNPQRIEQRIGRCHRYGQKHDVVVINFVNQGNAADKRVYELLNSKFNLFDGIFGSSDEILGALDGSLDFEKRLNEIWMNCRTEEEINEAFDALQAEMEDIISNRMYSSKKTLLEHFDEDVIKKLKIRQKDDTERIDDYNKHLWLLASSVFEKEAASIDDKTYSISIDHPIGEIEEGCYSILKTEDTKHIRCTSPLGEYVLREATRINPASAEVVFDYSGYGLRSASLEQFSGQSGYCIGYKIKAESQCDQEEQFIMCGIADSGEIVPDDFGRKLMELKALSQKECSISEDVRVTLSSRFASELERYKEELAQRSQEYLNMEIDNLYAWADENLYPMEEEVGRIRKALEANRRMVKKVRTTIERFELKKEETTLRKKLTEKMEECEKMRDYYDSQSEQQIKAMEKALESCVTEKIEFVFRWTLK